MYDLDFRKAYESVRKEVLYNILIEFGVPMKPVRLVKKSFNETYSRVRMCKHLSDNFPIQNRLQTDVLLPLLFQLCFQMCYHEDLGKPVGTET
jgi:hypothetical protein